MERKEGDPDRNQARIGGAVKSVTAVGGDGLGRTLSFVNGLAVSND
jgi:hypothetical protein